MADLSVIIPCYNGEPFIGATIESCLSQTDPPREIVVIDDGSKDQSAAVVERYVANSGGAGGKVVLLRQANAGESRARNVGIAKSTGKFIGFLDADDLWLPEKTAKQLALLERDPTAIGTHTRVFNFTKEIDDLGRPETEKSKNDPSVRDLMEYHWIAPSSLVVRRAVLERENIRFEEAVRHSEDMLFVADLRLAGQLRLVDEPLLAKRIHAHQQTKKPWHPVYSLESRITWCRNRRFKLGEPLATELEQHLSNQLVRHLEDRYWRRDLAELPAMVEYARKLCPDALNKSMIGQRKIHPRWVYTLKDALTGRPGAK